MEGVVVTRSSPRVFSFPLTVFRGVDDALLFSWWPNESGVSFESIPEYLKEKVELLLMAFCGKMFSATNGFDEIVDVGSVTYSRNQVVITIYLEVEEIRNGNNT